MRNKKLTKYLYYSAEQKTGKGARSMFEFVVQSYATSSPVDAYAIADKGTDEYVGSLGYTQYKEGVLEFYYNIIEGKGGNGYAVEATAGVVDALPDHLEVRAYCHPDNKAAHAVAKKCGFAPQGLAYNKNTKSEFELFVKKPVQGSSAANSVVFMK